MPNNMKIATKTGVTDDPNNQEDIADDADTQIPADDSHIPADDSHIPADDPQIPDDKLEESSESDDEEPTEDEEPKESKNYHTSNVSEYRQQNRSLVGT